MIPEAVDLLLRYGSGAVASVIAYFLAPKIWSILKNIETLQMQQIQRANARTLVRSVEQFGLYVESLKDGAAKKERVLIMLQEKGVSFPTADTLIEEAVLDMRLEMWGNGASPTEVYQDEMGRTINDGFIEPSSWSGGFKDFQGNMTIVPDGTMPEGNNDA